MATRPLVHPMISRRALKIEQQSDHPLFLFTLTGEEILQVADISRIARSDDQNLIGYQRPEVRQHIQEIVAYLDGEEVLFPNSIIIALSSACRFIGSRGPNVSDGLSSGGTLEIPIPAPGEAKPGWIVDGQQRAIALSRSRRKDLAVPVNAFIADAIELQRDQFLRVNNTRPLPRGLVTELLPEVSIEISPRLSAAKIPSELTNLLNTKEESPFQGLIRRASTPKAERKQTVITDTSVTNMLQESLTSASGALFPFRNMATGETDFESIWRVLIAFWVAVRETFPEAWGRPAQESRLMHGVGIRAMGRLMDRVMASIDADQEDALSNVAQELQLVAPYCRWTEGEWEGLNAKWNDLENTPKDIKVLANFLVRTYLQERKR
jgi:DGQHR domain-containing protein